MVIRHSLVGYLLLTEFTWVFIYILFLIIGVYFDIAILLSISILVLVLAGLEFSIGLLLYYFF